MLTPNHCTFLVSEQQLAICGRCSVQTVPCGRLPMLPPKAQASVRSLLRRHCHGGSCSFGAGQTKQTYEPLRPGLAKAWISHLWDGGQAGQLDNLNED